MIYPYLGVHGVEHRAHISLQRRGDWQRRYPRLSRARRGAARAVLLGDCRCRATGGEPFRPRRISEAPDLELGWIRNMLRVAGQRDDATGRRADRRRHRDRVRDWIGDEHGQLHYYRERWPQLLKRHRFTEVLDRTSFAAGLLLAAWLAFAQLGVRAATDQCVVCADGFAADVATLASPALCAANRRRRVDQLQYQFMERIFCERAATASRRRPARPNAAGSCANWATRRCARTASGFCANASGRSRPWLTSAPQNLVPQSHRRRRRRRARHSICAIQVQLHARVRSERRPQFRRRTVAREVRPHRHHPLRQRGRVGPRAGEFRDRTAARSCRTRTESRSRASRPASRAAPVTASRIDTPRCLRRARSRSATSDRGSAVRSRSSDEHRRVRIARIAGSRRSIVREHARGVVRTDRPRDVPSAGVPGDCVRPASSSLRLDRMYRRYSSRLMPMINGTLAPLRAAVSGFTGSTSPSTCGRIGLA